MIPRIIHQSWKVERVPDRWIAYQKSWRDLNPDYEYRYWTDVDNRKFVAQHFPEFLELYDGYPQGIFRADLARYLVISHYGGVYADMDFEALRPVDDLLAERSLVFGLEPQSHVDNLPAHETKLTRIVCNAFFAAVPRHPFWSHLMTRICAAKDEINVLDATGPFVLTRACDSYPRPQEISIIPSPLLYPIDNQHCSSVEFNLENAGKGAFAIHHWHGTWWRDWVVLNAWARIKRRKSVKDFKKDP